MYEMKDEYLTGIDFIDKEHRRLFEIAEETYQLKNDEFIPDKYDRIHNLLNELKDYTEMHFAHEEEYMQSIGYKKLFSQKVQHEAFVNWLEEHDLDHIDDGIEDQDTVVGNILTYLTDWLVEHILYTDKQIPTQKSQSI
ncbi:MAG: hemerythrin family protein [Lachnospiraceae bacterium]|nr:hemerythrin family protein [Lachnospiraceae bacterium]